MHKTLYLATMRVVTSLVMFAAVANDNSALCAEPARYQSRDGHPADHLPRYIRQVSGFGERPEWSHDSKRILFVDKPMGKSTNSIWKQV